MAKQIIQEISKDSVALVVYFDKRQFVSIETRDAYADALNRFSELVNKPIFIIDSEGKVEELSSKQLEKFGLKKINIE